MPNYTPYLNLEKPIPQEFYNVAVPNSNADIIDAEMSTASDRVSNFIIQDTDQKAVMNATIADLNVNLTGLIAATNDTLMRHTINLSNPHEVTSGQVNVLPLNSKSSTDSASLYPLGVSTVYVYSTEDSGDWFSTGTVQTFKAFTGDDGAFQIHSPVRPTDTGGKVFYRYSYIGIGWQPWFELVTATPPAWHFATLVAGWTSSPVPLRFYKDQFGVVHLEGYITRTSVNADITTLPEGYRPGTAKLSPAVAATHDETALVGTITAAPSGRLHWSPSGGVDASLSFLSIDMSFRTD